MAGRPFGRSLAQIFWAAIRLRCPRCGSGRMFAGPFKMHPRCPHCGMRFEREQGFFVGAIYINYIATMAIVVPGYFLLHILVEPTITRQLLLWGAFTLVFPMVFFRHSRSLWLAIAYSFNPDEPADTKPGES